MIGLAILLQTAGAAGAVVSTHSATVGDTIWVTRTVPVAPHQTVRPVKWEPPDPVELVDQPHVTVRGATVDIQYPLTVWRAGQHQVQIPGPLVLSAGGTVDSLPPQAVTLDIRSVLPSVSPESTPAPQPRASVVPRRMVTPVPLIVLLVMAGLPLFLLRRRWWRRGKPVPRSADRGGPAVAVPVERWVDAGERRAVASVAAAQLRAAVGRRAVEPAPALAAELDELLGALDRARFGSAIATVDADALTLFHRAAQLEERVRREGT